MQTVIRRDAQRPDDAVLVVALLDNRLQRARDADAVAAHDRRLARTVHVEEGRIQLLAVFCAELENVADFNCAADFQCLATLHARLARADGSQIKPRRHLDVALDGDVLQMETVLVRAGGHVICAAQTFVGKNYLSHPSRFQNPRSLLPSPIRTGKLTAPRFQALRKQFLPRLRAAPRPRRSSPRTLSHSIGRRHGSK